MAAMNTRQAHIDIPINCEWKRLGNCWDPEGKVKTVRARSTGYWR